jgi:hypothetical protein
MTLRCALPATFALTFLSAVLASAQAGPPPMKMGLWQSDITVQMSGMPNGVSVPAHTVTSQMCMTADTWKDALQNSQNRQRNLPVNCSTSNLQQDNHHYSADVQCTAQQGFTTTMHVDMQFDSDESMHGTTSMTMGGGGNGPQGMTMNSTIKSKFLSSDCGDVQPGKGKIVSPGGGPPPQH